MLTKKDPPRPIAPVGPSAPCYCLYVSPLITAPLDQVGWLTMGKRRALTFLKSWTHTSTRTHSHAHTHNQEMETTRNPPAVNNMRHVSRPPRFPITKQMTATSLSLRWEMLLLLDHLHHSSCWCNEAPATITLQPNTHRHTHTETSELWCFQQSGWD